MRKTIRSLCFLMCLLFLSLSFTSCAYVLLASDFNLGDLGAYNCRTCHDSRVVVCGDCGGEKRRTCRSCGGDGVATCMLCSGTGSRTCMFCGGLGGRSEYDYFSGYYVYRACSCVGGRVSCAMTTVCSCGDGKVNCATCDAQGYLPCPDCSSEVGTQVD